MVDLTGIVSRTMAARAWERQERKDAGRWSKDKLQLSDRQILRV